METDSQLEQGKPKRRIGKGGKKPRGKKPAKKTHRTKSDKRKKGSLLPMVEACRLPKT